MCIRTEGNKEPYMEQIKKYYSSIAELRARITEITKQLEESDEFQTEMQQIDSWLENEEILFAEYDDDIVRYLIDSIRVTDDLKLIINVKGGVSVTEELYQKKIEIFAFKCKKVLTFWPDSVIINAVKKRQSEYTYEKGLFPWLDIRGVSTKIGEYR